nr:transposon Ty3-G Gag-Pol polyprotein [Tanacetum cinerariifolium]
FRLSATTQDLPRSVICNVHGVNLKLLEIREQMSAVKEGGEQKFSKGAYFLGKMIWAKGYRKLIDLLLKQKNDLNGFKLSVYGNGENAHEHTRESMAPTTRNIATTSASDERVTRQYVEDALAQIREIINGLGDQNNHRAKQASQFNRLAKVEFLKFYNEDVMGWIFKCDQFFLIDSTSEENKSIIQEATIESVTKKSMPFVNQTNGRFRVTNVSGSNGKQPLLHVPTTNTNWKPKPNNPPRKQLTQKKYEDKRSEFFSNHEGDWINSVAGGKELVIVNECKDFQWQLYGQTFTTDGMLLLLGGCDMVLGIQWLSTLVPNKLPPARSHDHRIPLLPDTQPVNIKPYRHPPVQKDVIERMCVDYRQLNKYTIKHKVLIPIIEELVDELGGAVTVSKLKLRSGYHQIRMYKDDIAKTTFKTHEGHYEFLVISFVLTNAPLTFQALINEVFREFLRKITLVLFDDILIYSKSLEDHVKHLTAVLFKMKDHSLYAKESNFGVDAVEDFKEYTLRDYYCWLKTYCWWYKLKLLDNVVDSRVKTKMRIEQYFLMTDYSLWEVILNGDYPMSTRVIDGVVQPVTPTTAEQRESLSEEDINLKFLRTLPIEWRTHTLIWRNKTDLKDQSLDDLFNSLKIYEAEVKSLSSTSSNTQNIAFVSFQNTNNTNESVSDVANVSAASTKVLVSALPNVDTLSDVVIYSFFASRMLQLSQERALCKGVLTPKDTRRNVPVDTQRRNVPAKEEPTNYTLMAFTSSSSSSSDNEIQSGEGYRVIPPPYTGTFMPPKPDLVFHDALIVNKTVPTSFNVELSPTKSYKDLSQSNRPSAPLIEDWVSDSKDDSEGEPKNTQIVPTFVQPTKHVKTPRPSIKTVEHPISADHLRKDIPKSKGHSNIRNRKACFVSVLTRSRIVPLSAARPITIAVLQTKVHHQRPVPHGNMSYLFDFEEINGGYVAFGGNPKGGKITGKGKIRIDTKCIVLSPNFKLSAEDHVLLRVPRENYMYNVNLKNIVPSGDLTCLFAKETLDESNLWHRRLGHINFKTMNKLVKGKFDGKADEEFLVGYSNQPNVTRSGPTWLFDIDTLTKFMNYQPVTTGNQPHLSADPQNTNDDATFEVTEPEFEVKEPESEVHVSPSSSAKTKKHDDKTKREAKGKSPVELSTGFRNLSKEFEDFSDNSINEVNASSTPILAIGQISTNNTNPFSAAGPSNTAVSPTLRKSLYVDPS